MGRDLLKIRFSWCRIRRYLSNKKKCAKIGLRMKKLCLFRWCDCWSHVREVSLCICGRLPPEHTKKIHFGNNEPQWQKKIAISVIVWIPQVPNGDQRAWKIAKTCVRVRNTENFLETGYSPLGNMDLEKCVRVRNTENFLESGYSLNPNWQV